MGVQRRRAGHAGVIQGMICLGGYHNWFYVSSHS